jgi:hypothetical protein
MCFHLNSNGRFVGRLQVDDALGIPERGFVIAARRRLFCQPHEGPIRLSSKFRSLVQDPVVITSWKEIARINARSELEITRGHGILEPQHVDLARPSRNPPHNLVVDLDEHADVGKGMTEVVEQLSEVRPRLAFVGVQPELERESRAVLQVSPQRDQRQKPLQAKRVEGVKTPAVQGDLDSTEKSDLQPRRGFATDPADSPH